jgi:hypothetical protein
MKTINYKNSFQALFDLIFNRKKFLQKINSKIQHEKSVLKYSLEQNFEEKVRFLLNEKDRRITNREFQIPVMQMPIFDPIKNPYYFNTSINSEEKKIEKLFFSISDNNFDSIDIKRMAARRIAEILIEGDFIKSRSNGSEIEFYIQYI